MKIVVLAGGLSTERNVSLSTGTKVCGALRSLGHEVAFVDMFLGLEGYSPVPDNLFQAEIPQQFLYIGKEAPNLDEVRASRRDTSPSMFGPGVLELCSQADIVFLALHGACGEDGRVQACFDLMGIPYTGSGYLGSAIAMDKNYTKRIIEEYDVLTPHWEVISYEEKDIDGLTQKLPVPCVIKVLKGGSSIGVSVVKDRDGLNRALKDCLHLDTTVMVEEYIEGIEITCAVLDGEALPTVEIVPQLEFYDYESKYQPGATLEICPGRIRPEEEENIRKTALTVHKALGLSVYSRSDFILTKEGKAYFLEVNTLPGMTPTSLVPQEAAAVGIDYESLCSRIVECSLDK